MTVSLTSEVHGSGPGLVLIHGTGSTGAGTWGPVIAGLAAENTVVLPNLPGSAGSPLPDGPLDLDTVADQVVAAAREAGLERFSLAGGSLGVSIAVRAAARHPELVERLVSVVGFAYPRPSLRLALELVGAMTQRGDRDVNKLLALLSFSDDYLAGLPDEVRQELLRQIVALEPEPGIVAQLDLALRVDVRDDLPGLRLPTLVLAPLGDRFVAPPHSYELAAGVPGAQLREMPGGHAVLLEDPQRCLAELRTFLDG